ncbi:hypothetical protein MNBD_CHLOROFLEXI01-1426 [hydrothermal vent metagenome]|uniref:3-keto-disaccharide hydrolase domain-containing protein n=1 Tax=hydrothermal vent metagenome TaxID=652676 RepID=A0A3B0VG83_9ZZZZ
MRRHIFGSTENRRGDAAFRRGIMEKATFCFLLLILLLAACSNFPAEDVATQEMLLETDFVDASAWSEKIDAEAGTAVQINNNSYQLSSETASYVWGFGEERYDDVVLETAVRQLSTEPNNAYGLVCRAPSSQSGNGYYFLISGDGLISIRKVERGLSSPVVDWTPHSAVRQGKRPNQLRAICAGEYLAFYVNNQLVGEGEDGRFADGFAGFAASGSEDGAVQVGFSQFSIHAAQISRE